MDEINLEFHAMTTAIDANRNSGLDTDNNGLAFLTAFILEGISTRSRKAESVAC
jgi:hypothetical protein